MIVFTGMQSLPFNPDSSPGINSSLTSLPGIPSTWRPGLMSHYFYLKSPFLSVVEDTQEGSSEGSIHASDTVNGSLARPLHGGGLFKSTLTGKQNHAIYPRMSLLVATAFMVRMCPMHDLRGLPVRRSIALEDYGVNQTGESQPGLKIYPGITTLSGGKGMQKQCS